MNPLLLRLIPLAVSAAAGFAIAWWIQGLRLTSAEHEFVEYKQEQVRLAQKRKDDADKQRNEAADRYSKVSKQLAESIEAGDVFKRCVAAGRCGPTSVGVCKQPTNTAGIGLSAPRKPDDPGQNELPLAGNDAAINDCAVTTLQLNSLQTDIEAQPGYKE